MTATPNPPGSKTVLLLPLGAITSIAAAFCVVVSAVMLYQHRIAAGYDPWKSPQLRGLKEELRAASADESLRTEIRRLDLEFRQRYVRRLAVNRTGGWLLVGGMAAMLLAAKQTAKLRSKAWLPSVKRDTASETRELATQARWSVAGVSVIIALGLATLAVTARSPLAGSIAEVNELLGRTTEGEPLADSVSLDEFHANWPRFRGSDGGGATRSALNLNLDAKSGDSVLWKSPIPAPGFSSPVVWGNCVFISGGDAERRELFCYDATDGKLLWRRAVENVPGTPTKQPEIYDQPGYAASTMATDGRLAFVIFANGDLAAFTLEGMPAWSKNIGVPKNPYGYAASLAVWPGKLIVQLDQDEGTAGGSKLLAFDCASGRLLWERSRRTPATWATPIIIEAAGKTQVIALGNPHVISYSLADGNELWRAESLEGEITPSPIFAGGFVIAVSPSASLVAIRPDGAGDVTKSHIAWKTEDNVPDITSPVSNGELVFTVTSTGGLACFDVKDGKKLWEKNLEMEVQSSPAIAVNRLLVLGAKGDLLLLEAGRELKELDRVKLDDAFYASPAFANGRVYLRGSTNLWCLGKK